MEQIKVELQDSFGSDRGIADAAWTSSYSNDRKKDKDDAAVAKLVKLLANERHGVPFETVVFRFWIKLPIFIDRQLVKHRIASHSGASGRYRTMFEEYLACPEDVKAIIAKVPELADTFEESYDTICKAANAFYQSALDLAKKARADELISNSEYKRVREIARGALPQGNMTETVFTLNLRSFANFQFLRNSDHAQKEIKYIAELMLAAVEEANIAPVAIQTLKENNWII